MGNNQYKPPLNPYANASASLPVKPFVQSTNPDTAGLDESFGELDAHVNVVQQTVYALGLNCQSKLTQEERDRVSKEFDRLSKNGLISKRKILEYFRMHELQDTYLANEIYECLDHSSMAHTGIDLEKFINCVSIFAKGTKQEKLQLLYTFFDKGTDVHLSKEDLKAHISGTILSMQGVSFDDVDLEKLKQLIAASPESEIDEALDILVDQIFKGQKAKDELSFNAWQQWFEQLDGVDDVLQN